MSCYSMNERMPITHVHTGEAEARHGALCGDCAGFECLGIYDGMCDPDDPFNWALLLGADRLERTGTRDYEYELVDAGGLCDEVDGRLFFRGDRVATVDLGGLSGEVVALLHGEMMRHAAGDRPGHFPP